MMRPFVQYNLFLWFLSAFLAASSFNWVSAWKATHWYFSYEHGYVKRGLIGTLVDLLATSVSPALIVAVSVGASVCATALFLCLLYRALRPYRDAIAIGPSAVGIWLATAPGLVPQLFYDTGRFDVFALVCLMINVLAVAEIEDRNRTFLVILLSSWLSILIHEAYFFWVPGISLAAWMYCHYRKDRDWPLVLLFGGVMVITTLITGLSGYGDRFGFEEIKAILQAEGNEIVDASLQVHFRSPLDNFQYAWSHAWMSSRALVGAAMALAVYAPYVAVLWRMRSYIGEVDGGRARWLVPLYASALGPIPLFFLGLDWGRWLSMINVGLLCIVAFLLVKHPGITKRLPHGVAWMILVGIVIQVSLGPFGIARPFPQSAFFSTLETVAIRFDLVER